MDTKTPPIPLKPQERVFLPKKRTERVVADVSLPPLTPYPSNRPKNNGSPATSRDPSYPIQHRRRSLPCHHRDHRKRRPYRYGTRHLFLDFQAGPTCRPIYLSAIHWIRGCPRNQHSASYFLGTLSTIDTGRYGSLRRSGYLSSGIGPLNIKPNEESEGIILSGCYTSALRL